MTATRLESIGARDARGRPIEAEGLSEEGVRQSVLRVLEDNVLFSIATVTGDGRAHVNTAYFCYSDDLELYFLSDPGSLHCRNLATNSSMAVAVFSSAQKWVDPGRGVQLFGTCSQARGRRAGKAEELYEARFPAHASWKASLSEADLARAYRFYRFVTTKLKILDERNFGDAVFVHASVKRIARSR